LIANRSTATHDGKLRDGVPRYTHPGVLVIEEIGYAILDRVLERGRHVGPRGRFLPDAPRAA